MLPIYRELIAAGIRIWVFRYVKFLSRTWFVLNPKSLKVATLQVFNIKKKDNDKSICVVVLLDMDFSLLHWTIWQW